MSKSIKGTKTEKNLLKSFAGESQARNRYSYSAKIASNEGYEQIAWIFGVTAEQERVHAKNFFKFLEGGDLEITASYPAGIIGTTIENLKAAAAGEYHEWSDLYPGFAKIADEEGFPQVAAKFRSISVAENAHEKRYLGLLENLEKNTAFKKTSKTFWQCRNCGYFHESDEALKKCPACEHPQAYFEVMAKNW